MSVARSMAEVLDKHVRLEVEGIDRMYLNVYVPQLQRELGVASFFRFHRGYTFASSALMQPITERFIAKVEQFVKEQRVALVSFEKHQRKDEVMKEHLAKFTATEGVLFVGKAQEKAPVFRTERRRDPKTGQPFPWIVRATAMVNHFYFYCVDEDFGPFFLKFCSYFPYNAKLCLNGHEYMKCQLRKARIAYEALDNGVLSCAQPQRLAAISESLTAERIDALLRKWLRRLPHPFTAKDRAAGYRYDISILQAEFSLTQVLDQPVNGRVFFEEVIRENLDIGRPAQVQLIFDRRITRRTPGRFRTRVITEGVTPSLHVDYKRTRIKQYFKEGRALRTETTINNAYDFEIGKRLKNLPRLRKIGFAANRRLLTVQRLTHDCLMAEHAFNRVQRPLQVDGQRASALPFATARVQQLLSALLPFRLLPRGFANADLREQLARLQGIPPQQLSAGRMTYELRRLRMHGLIERIRGSHRYRLTQFGLRLALFFTRAYNRLLRPGFAAVLPDACNQNSRLRASFQHLENTMDHLCQQIRLAA